MWRGRGFERRCADAHTQKFGRRPSAFSTKDGKRENVEMLKRGSVEMGDGVKHEERGSLVELLAINQPEVVAV